MTLHQSEIKPGYTFLFSFLLTSRVPPMWGHTPCRGRDNTPLKFLAKISKFRPPLKFLVIFPKFSPLKNFSQKFWFSTPWIFLANFLIFSLLAFLLFLLISIHPFIHIIVKRYYLYKAKLCLVLLILNTRIISTKWNFY